MDLPAVKTKVKEFLSVYTTWGRVADRTIFNLPPDKNPDPIAEESRGERYFRISLNPYVKAGLNQRDISRLFISARGIGPTETGAYFPPQLIYTDPDNSDNAQYEALAKQYDEYFDPPFSEILRSLQQPALSYGRAIGEIMWMRENGGLKATTIKSRDPDEFLLNPPDEPPGIYKKRHVYSSAYLKNYDRMPDGKFLVVTYDSLFNNPYGTSCLKAIAEMTETWNTIYDAWRMGLVRSGYGSWLGEYDTSISGESSKAKTEREKFLDEVKKIANGTASIFDARNNIRAEKVQLEAQAFLDFHESYIKAVGVVMVGSSTALTEGRFGSYSREEASGTRRKSENEQMDALLMSISFQPFNRWFLHKNFNMVKAVPQLQLIRPELITPTTPEGQKTQEEITLQTEPTEMQEAAEHIPVEFPDSGPDPNIYALVREEAREFLENMPVISYNNVTRDNQADVFTVKKLRTWESEQQQNILHALKSFLLDSFDEETEQASWQAYLAMTDNYFRENGLELTHDIEVQLMPSFRQARQRSWQAGIDTVVDRHPDEVYGIRLETRKDLRVRPVHRLWHDVVLDPQDERIDRIRPPMDFMCRCHFLPVLEEDRSQYPLTPENKIPKVFPGETYRGYA